MRCQLVVGQPDDLIARRDIAPGEELTNDYRAATKASARQAVGAWIEGQYNRRRWHSAMGVISPVRIEAAHPKTAQAA